MSGSHSDTVVMGGPYDGALGALGAIAAIHALRAAGFQPAKSLEAVMFTTEEASRFSIPCLGRYLCPQSVHDDPPGQRRLVTQAHFVLGCSQAMTGFIKPEVLETFKDDNGTSFVAAATRVGYIAASPQVSCACA